MTDLSNSDIIYTYAPETLAASPNDKAYFEQRERIYRKLRYYEEATARQLADSLGLPIRVVTAKLQSLRKDGFAGYEKIGASWYDQWAGE